MADRATLSLGRSMECRHHCRCRSVGRSLANEACFHWATVASDVCVRGEVIRRGQAGFGCAGRGEAGFGKAVKVRQGRARLVEARRGVARQLRHGKARRGRSGKVRLGLARQFWHGWDGLGQAGQGGVWRGAAVMVRQAEAALGADGLAWLGS